MLAELGVALMPKDAGGQTPLQLAEKHQLEFGDGSVAKFVFRQLNPAVTDKQIARRWRVKVRAPHRAFVSGIDALTLPSHKSSSPG
eukprot:COSAG01_NODE_6310_length_3744_cov_1.544033_5_plen_86_part_00